MSFRFNVVLYISDGSSPNLTDDFMQNLFIQIQQSLENIISPPKKSCRKYIESLPDTTLSEERCKALDGTCVICQDLLKSQDHVLSFGCRHMFHRSCIIPWCETAHTCPTCRFEYKMDDDDQEKDRLERITAQYSSSALNIMKSYPSVEHLINDAYNSISNASHSNSKQLIEDFSFLINHDIKTLSSIDLNDDFSKSHISHILSSLSSCLEKISNIRKRKSTNSNPSSKVVKSE